MMKSTSHVPSTAEQSPTRRYGPLLLFVGVLAAAFAVIYANGWHKQLRLENVVAIRDAFQAFLGSNRVLALLAYVAVYALAVSLSLPGALVLTLTGGLMFGWLVGGFAAVTGGTIGASVIFFIAKSAFGETLAQKAGPTVQKLSAGFRENALSYLLFLRLVPVFPVLFGQSRAGARRRSLSDLFDRHVLRHHTSLVGFRVGWCGF